MTSTAEHSGRSSTGTAGLLIVDTGRATTIQDLGRVGARDIGVPPAGAVDRPGHRLVNRLVGNPEHAATLETHGGLVIEAVQPLVLATSSDGHRHTLAAGRRLRVDPAPGTMWAHLAVRGGIACDPVLGSRSQDTLSGLGPPALADGDVLPVGPDPGTALPADHAPVRRRSPTIALWPGPRVDRIHGALDLLVERPWTVTTSVSRVGVRLEAGPFRTTTSDRLPSEGLVEGAIQITPSGEPVIMLANHPTTGGYPVVAVVDPADVPVVAQAVPGSRLHFTRV